MQLTPDMLFEAAMSLPENERLDLAVRLMDTVPQELLSEDDAEFLAELERRFNDDSPTVPWSEIRDRG